MSAQYCFAVHLNYTRGLARQAHIHSSKVQDGEPLLLDELRLLAENLHCIVLDIVSVVMDSLKILKHLGSAASALSCTSHEQFN